MVSRTHSTLEEWHLTLLFQTNDPLDIKNYIGRQNMYLSNFQISKVP